jgi:hypothetical protein
MRENNEVKPGVEKVGVEKVANWMPAQEKKPRT